MRGIYRVIGRSIFNLHSLLLPDFVDFVQLINLSGKVGDLINCFNGLIFKCSSENKPTYNKFYDRIQEHGGRKLHVEQWSVQEFIEVDSTCEREEAELIQNIFGGCIRAFKASRGVESEELNNEIEQLTYGSLFPSLSSQEGVCLLRLRLIP